MIYAFVLVTGFTFQNNAMTAVVIPGIATEQECHRLAAEIQAPKHRCIEYRIAGRYTLERSAWR
jgi:hypothetical protein